MSNTCDGKRQAIAGGIWEFLGDIGAIWFGYELLCLVGVILVLAVTQVCSLLFGPALGLTLGFWIVIVGGIALAIIAVVVWQKNESKQRDQELKRIW